MSTYTPTIGLEIHAELNTNTKMFCNSKNDPDEKRPNTNICPVCMAHPGTLPTINKKAIQHIVRVGTALKGTIADFSEFDRKNYFYPDIPKGYQISQYKYPIVSGGALNGIDITRVHMEEDTARSIHDTNVEGSLVDFNRAGVPLMELVTEPVVKNSKEAVAFARELQTLLRTLGASHANMEKGEMRVEANISVSSEPEKMGTKVELKNLNSFKVVEKAIEYEIVRQSKLIDEGKKVIQETRGWDEQKNQTFSQRIKEEANDYRYFPEPDLPKLKLSSMSEFQNVELPELPWEKRERYTSELGIKEEDAEIYIQNVIFGALFEDVAKILADRKIITLASNYITSDLVGIYKGKDIRELTFSSKDFAELVKMVHAGDISSRGAKDILLVMTESGKSPKEIADKEGLLQKSDESSLMQIVEKVISENEKVALEYKSGNENVLQFLVGQGMKASKGAANPQVLAKLFMQKIK